MINMFYIDFLHIHSSSRLKTIWAQLNPFVSIEPDSYDFIELLSYRMTEIDKLRINDYLLCKVQGQ